jgi:hypothetical protein
MQGQFLPVKIPPSPVIFWEDICRDYKSNPWSSRWRYRFLLSTAGVRSAALFLLVGSHLLEQVIKSGILEIGDGTEAVLLGHPLQDAAEHQILIRPTAVAMTCRTAR